MDRAAAGKADWPRWFFVAAFGLIGPAAFQAPKALISIVLPMATLSLLWWMWRTHKLSVGAVFRRGWALWLFFLVTLASVAWSIDQEGSLARSVRFFGEVLLGMGLLSHIDEIDDSWRRPALCGLGLGLGVSALLALIDIASGFVIADGLGRASDDLRFVEEPRLHYSWGAVVAAMLLLPGVLALARITSLVPAVVLALLGAGAILALVNLTAKVALAAAIAAGVCVFATSRCRWILGAGSLAVLVALPLAFPLSPSLVCTAFAVGTGSSAGHRLMIYNVTDAKIGERPVLGWGMNTSSEVLQAPQLAQWPECARGRVESKTNLEMPRHPHDLPLQIRLELGLPGIIAAGLLLLVLFRGLSRPGADRMTVAVGWGAMIAAFVQGLLGFGVWQGWLIASYFLVAAVVQMSIGPPRKKT